MQSTKIINDKKADVVCLGQAVLDCIVRGRETVPGKPAVYRAESIGLSTGGDAVNESFQLAQMGYKVQLVCGLGQDSAGHVLESEARLRGVDLSRICLRSELTTPIANLVVSRDGSRYSINSPATRLEGYVPSCDSVLGARVVSFASLFRAPLDRPDVICRLIRAAHEDGAVISCDTKLPTFREVSLEEIKEVLPLIDYIFPNEKEAAYYTGRSDYADMARVLRSYGIRNVIIKTGPEGCYASLQEGEYMLPAMAADPVDTTGAGDSFVAGFLAGILEGETGRQCLDRGLKRAAECVQHMGAVRSL